MSEAIVLFESPEDVNELEGVFETLRSFGIEADVDAVSPGQLVEAQILDCSDPQEEINQVLTQLRECGADYFACSSSYVERSRGDRYLAQLYVNIDGQSFKADFPWNEGEPDLDERSLILARVNKSTVAKIVDKFLEPNLTPKPR